MPAESCLSLSALCSSANLCPDSGAHVNGTPVRKLTPGPWEISA